jgi:hypothetical protein
MSDASARTHRLATSELYPWYDSNWLTAYSRAQAIISQVKPALLSEFVHAFRVFSTRPNFETKVLDRIFADDVLDAIRREIALLKPTDLEMHEARMFGRFVVHDHPFCNELQRLVVPLVSRAVGEAVEASYNFLSLYGRLGKCPPHLDSPTAKWTLDLCVDQSVLWPVHVSQVQPWPGTAHGIPLGENWEDEIKRSPSLEFATFTLRPGQAVVFSGSSQWHYRERIPEGGSRQFCDLLFFHFIPVGTAELVKPENWARIFGIPQLDPAGSQQ